jgi:3-dehydro-L-gulonate 2-dehydrogenase
MRVTFGELEGQFQRVLLGLGFSTPKAAHCARIFAQNSLDGVYSHGLNRFPAFVRSVREGLVDMHAEPEVIRTGGMVEYWDGHQGPGMYIASLAMAQAIALARRGGMGAVSVRNTNHWMRGGTYGWQAADSGCIGICATNTIANMPAWGSAEPRLGNNPLVIAVPRDKGAVVLDMAMSQFSYGKLQEYEWESKELPVPGGYDEQGRLTTDPGAIKASRRTLPIGYWKGSGLSLVLDLLTAGLSGGQSVGAITGSGKEYRLSQFFLCIDAAYLDAAVIEGVIAYTKTGNPLQEGTSVSYPGERTLATRLKNQQEGIPVNETAWKTLLEL